ncbi:hypothetical protein COEREDRAFT_100860 [Coemansia reversa NRRL 1564]|uniref:Uncharacterized protein n=1 Tax=Coemansia reversa (strain ATCC 12441 / NRRL 1564) TaxID=763665 RepID=A0A2G5BI64_COERN|nr:hypothetical protein COEREDRAFT_100860 [Coemansia reversa NRRL 1564]|eukprot:PIA18700.1 hypothetical protein COEREDRAFT_100860 [Coemansia reversa NRRL 1564]
MDVAGSSNTPTRGSASSVSSISIEQLRASFRNGSPTVVSEMLIPFLRQESKSNGDMQVINEISESVSNLLYPWFQNSEAMRGDEQKSLYTLLRPDGRLVDTLLQYHLMQRQRGPAAGSSLAAGVGQSNTFMFISTLSLPAEYQTAQSADIGGTMALPAEFARRLSAGSTRGSDAGFCVDALEYFVYHFCRALVLPRGSSSNVAGDIMPSSPIISSAGKPYHGYPTLGVAASHLVREYIGFFMPAAVPERLLAVRNDMAIERSPMKHIRERLHDFSPIKGHEGAMDQRDSTRKPGTVYTDLLDVCDYEQSLELANFFVSCAAFLWLPTIPVDILASVRAAQSVKNAPLSEPGSQVTSPRVSHDAARDTSNWVWIPNASQLAALHLFHILVGYLAKGERQMERYHLTGEASTSMSLGNYSPASCKTMGAGETLAAREIEAYDKRIGMNGTIRDTLRSRSLSTAVADTLGLVLASCGRTGFLDSEIWISFLDATASIWIRYIMPWRGSRTEASLASMRDGSTAEISPLWQSRIPLMIKGISSVLYGQTLSLFLRQMSSPGVDLLAHTAAVHRAASGETRQGHGVQTWIHDAVSSVIGHQLTMDVLAVLERVVSAFSASDLRAILAAADRYQLEAFLRQRNYFATPSSLQLGTLGMTFGDAELPQTPTKRAPFNRNAEALAVNATFEQQIVAAQELLVPYAQDIISCRSGSQTLDAVITDVLGKPPRTVFGHAPSPLLRETVHALHGAEVLAERQLRLIVPEGSADQARSVVSDIFLILSRLFSASDDAPIVPWSWSGTGGIFGTAGGQTGGSSESMRARAQCLHEAQSRIRVLYGKLAVLFHTTRKDIEAVVMLQDDALVNVAVSSAESGHGAVRPIGSSSSFGQRLASRSRRGGQISGELGTPEMEHGSLTPRGRWELKTGRKKFTTQSLLASPQCSQKQSSPLAPEWRLGTHRSTGVASILQDEMLQPRGPRAYYEARSYENQWLLDRILVLNVEANKRYQWLLDWVEAISSPIPTPVRTFKLEFRWAAAYPNIRFILLVLVVLRLIFWLF